MRRRALLGALVIALAGVAVAYGVWHATGDAGGNLLPTWLTGR
ncbi:MAG: hypothetical protein AVDCRST_MAG64-2124 [uncultured Phycisphaerae bacterium]|uniref:Uncharacterized protein n=1 Tax=uncultured Phycisphaerae bacterium TaxID=904963 RepID=A0A6J4P7F6_9BACT|nr:MAG: hypothetical protein AVDCRST_MAG64-2124 [uncultured Phycisphaerae bacterium]